jgi:hypothetical protein
LTQCPLPTRPAINPTARFGRLGDRSARCVYRCRSFWTALVKRPTSYTAIFGPSKSGGLGASLTPRCVRSDPALRVYSGRPGGALLLLPPLLSNVLERDVTASAKPRGTLIGASRYVTSPCHGSTDCSRKRCSLFRHTRRGHGRKCRVV